MRIFLASLVALAAASSACKARQDGAKVRDEGDKDPILDLNAQLSEIAAGLEADASIYYAAAFGPRDGVLALDDERVLTPAELDALRAQTAALNARLKKAQDAADRRDAERRATLTRLTTRLDAATLALKGIEPSDTERYRQGLADLRRVMDEMEAAVTAGTAAACPAGYVAVKGDAAFGTRDFCVMKFEAKRDAVNKPASGPAGKPWATPKWDEAINACALLGAKYELVSNPEWMTIATSIAQNPANWQGGAVGRGEVNVGAGNFEAAGPDNTPCVNAGDACSAGVWAKNSRTHKLADGTVIWDISSNAREWVNYTNETKVVGRQIDIKEFAPTAKMPLKDVRPARATHPFWSDSWGATQGLGVYWGSAQPAKHAVRGGASADEWGIFGLMFWWEDTESAGATGFRCAFHP